MNFLALNDDVKFIIANHLKSDNKIKKHFMTKEDDKLQKILFDAVEDMTLNIEDVIFQIKMKLIFLKKIIIKYIL